MQWDFEDALQKAYAFFRCSDQLIAEVRKLLFLCREAAGADVHGTVTNIALCSLLDSTVNLVFEQKIEQTQAEAVSEFDDARSKLLALIGEKMENACDIAKKAWL